MVFRLDDAIFSNVLFLVLLLTMLGWIVIVDRDDKVGHERGSWVSTILHSRTEATLYRKKAQANNLSKQATKRDPFHGV